MTELFTRAAINYASPDGGVVPVVQDIWDARLASTSLHNEGFELHQFLSQVDDWQ